MSVLKKSGIFSGTITVYFAHLKVMCLREFSSGFYSYLGYVLQNWLILNDLSNGCAFCYFSTKQRVIMK